MSQHLLVTGAFGNIGSHTVDALLAAGHKVRALGRTPPNKALRRRWGSRVEIVLQDLRETAGLDAALRDIGTVVHLAYVIPPEALADPAFAEACNIGGTTNLIAAAKKTGARFLFASSLDVFGHTNHLPPPRRLTDPVMATDIYTQHKLTCEELVKNSGLRCGILRFADVPPLVLRGPVPIMFEIPVDQRIETLHPYDAGLATATAATSEETWGKTWLIGGGARCQVRYGDYLAAFLGAMGMGGPLPPAAFTTKPYCTDWLDTEESQRVFKYQRHTFEDIVRDISALLGWKRPFTAIARPFVRRYMLSLSPYLR